MFPIETIELKIVKLHYTMKMKILFIKKRGEQINSDISKHKAEIYKIQ